MKKCISCSKLFESNEWMCPNCSYEPSLLNGFRSFSPELALINDGLNCDAHHILNDIQEKSFWFRQRNKIIQDAIKKYFANASDILEIGCGSGYVLNGIRQVLSNARLTATEIYVNGLEYTSTRVSQPCEFLQMDARNLPFNREFDLVGAFDVLEHIDEDELVIDNMQQSLKSGGGIILTVPQHPWLWSHVDDISFHKRRYTRHQLSNMLSRKGFDILLDTSFMFFLTPIMMIQRLLNSKFEKQNATRELELPNLIDKIFELILAFERNSIRCGARFPIGGSRLVVAKLK